MECRKFLFCGCRLYTLIAFEALGQALFSWQRAGLNEQQRNKEGYPKLNVAIENNSFASICVLYGTISILKRNI